MQKHVCSFGEGIVIKPNGVDELVPCDFDLVEIHENVRVEVLRCKRCGEISYGWFRQDNTIDTFLDNESDREGGC